MEWVSILVVGAVAILFWWLSNQRVKRLHAFTDRFALAFCEAAEHVLPAYTDALVLQYRKSESGLITVLPAEEQPDGMRDILSRGVDAYVMERLRTMYQMRDEAQALLTTVNLVGDKFNAPMNYCYDLSNLFFSFVDDMRKLRTQEDLKSFTDYIEKQKFIRNTTLAAIVSDACKMKISVP